MSKIEDVPLFDSIGTEYTFEVYQYTYREISEVDDVAGVYVFMKRGGNQYRTWRKILYIGKTKSFRHRLTYHEKRECAIRMKVTHFGVLPIDNEQKRGKIEERLILSYDPPLNYRVG